MTNSNRSGGVKKHSAGKSASDLVYVKLPDKKPLTAKKPSQAKSPDVNSAAQKAESKRRSRSVNPKNETW